MRRFGHRKFCRRNFSDPTFDGSRGTFGRWLIIRCQNSKIMYRYGDIHLLPQNPILSHAYYVINTCIHTHTHTYMHIHRTYPYTHTYIKQRHVPHTLENNGWPHYHIMKGQSSLFAENSPRNTTNVHKCLSIWLLQVVRGFH